MEQFLFRDENLSGEAGKRTLVIDGEESFHLFKVLRTRAGENILATNGAGKTLLCVVTTAGKDRTVCEVVEEYDDLNTPRREFCIAMALLKPMSKVETALEKCTELGARRFLLFYSERSESGKPRVERLQTIIKSAVKQSLRSRIPELVIVKDLENAAQHGRIYDARAAMHEKAEESFTGRLHRMENGGSAIAMIGPEGGFSETEIAFLIENGYESLSLGKGRLRSETAAIAVATLLSTY